MEDQGKTVEAQGKAVNKQGKEVEGQGSGGRVDSGTGRSDPKHFLNRHPFVGHPPHTHTQAIWPRWTAAFAAETTGGTHRTGRSGISEGGGKEHVVCRNPWR